MRLLDFLSLVVLVVLAVVVACGVIFAVLHTPGIAP